MAGAPADLIDVPDDLVDVGAPGAAPARPAEPWAGASQGVPRPIGVAAPPAPSQPSRSIVDRVRGAVETAVEAVSMALGGTVGTVGGTLGGLAGAFAQGNFGTSAAARQVQDTATAAGERGAEAVRGPLRTAFGLGQEMSPAGQEYTEGLTSVLQQLPAAVAGPSGMAGTGPAVPVRATMRAAGTMAKEAVGPELHAVRSAVDSVLPKVSPEGVNAVKSGIPVSPHQLTKNRLLRFMGESAEAAPFGGGETLRKTRIENFSRGLARTIDPEADGPLDSAAFKRLQDAAGESIGEIAGRTDVPRKSIGDLMEAVKDNEPSIRDTVSRFVRDVDAAADQHGGVIPGSVLRELRTRASGNSRSTTNGDLKQAWDRIARQLDDGLAEHASEADMAALLDARRRYAITKTLEPLVAKFDDGNIPPAQLQAALTRDKAGKRRMARGEGGDLGDYASLGRNLLKDQVLSSTPTTHLAFRGGHAAGLVGLGYFSAPLAATLWATSRAYNSLGPRAVKWLVERQTRRPEGATDAPAGPPPLELAPEGPLPPRPAGEVPASPLGDLTPDWETAPGAAPAAPRTEVVPAEGLVPPIDSPQGPARVRVAGEPAPPAKGAGMEIPAVPGRPDLPETMVAGAPAELALTEAVGAAMQEPTTVLARRQQEAARLAAETQSPEVQKVLAEHARKLERQAAAEAAKQKRLQDAAELRRVAAQTADPEIQQALHARAVTLEAAEPVPAGKAKELDAAPAAKPAKEPTKPLPTGEAVEVAAEVVEPAPAAAPAAAPVEPAPRRTEPRVGKAGPKDKFVVGRVYRDSQGNMAIRQADGSWKEVK